MAIRGPGKPAPPRVQGPDGSQPGKGGKATPAESALIRAGLAKTPQEARALMKSLVQKMGGAKEGSLDAQFAKALSTFQKENGLPQTGKLDGQTAAALKDAGVLQQGKPATPSTTRPTTKPTTGAPQPGKWGGFAGKADAKTLPTSSAPVEKGGQLELKELSQKAEALRPKTEEQLQNLMTNLGKFGFFGAGKGAAQLRGALKKFQGEHNLETTGKLDDATLQMLAKEGVLEGKGKDTSGTSKGAHSGATEGHGLLAQTPSETPSYENIYARGDPAAERAKQQADADGKRAVDERKKRKGRGGDGDGDGFGEDGEGAADAAELYGEDADSANAPSGDDDYADPRRGHAQMGDDDAEAGYYEVPSLGQQLEDALERLTTFEDDKGVLMYAWDVTFFVPGVYGAGQKAEALWHVVIDGAGPFDDVWKRAKGTLNDRLRGRDPTCPALTDDRFTRALRRARVRAGR